MNIEQISVTPELATKWLTSHWKRIETGAFIQRPISQSIINRYAMDMTAGKWLPTHQAIAFAENGDLLDGQHRLEAIKKSGKTLVMFVAKDCQNKSNGTSTIDVIDTGRPRSVSQMMSIHGWSNANNYAGAMRAIGRMVHGCSISASYSGIMHMLNQCGLRDQVDNIRKMAPSDTAKYFQGRWVGPMAYYSSVRPGKAREFARDVFNGTCTPGSPEQLFHRYYFGDLVARKWVHENINAICCCLHAFDEGKKIERIGYSNDHANWLTSLNPKLADEIRRVCNPNPKK
jgi:hypothetical protein